MMEYVYAGMWFLIGLLLIWKLRKENQVFVFAGGIFLFMGAWWLADALLPQLDLFGGVYAWLFRGVMAAALIVTGLVFIPPKKGTRSSGPLRKKKAEQRMRRMRKAAETLQRIERRSSGNSEFLERSGDRLSSNGDRTK